MLRLKQICNFDPLTGESAKLERLEADMEEIAASGRKAIVFSQWVEAASTGSTQRLQRGSGRWSTTAASRTKQREPILDAVQGRPRRARAADELRHRRVGLNLQFANYVFLFDRWWNPAVEDQAINRAHRIGQKSPVIVTRFISKDTIEERIDRVLRREAASCSPPFSAKATARTLRCSLNAAEIFGLFDLKARHGKGTRAIRPQAPELPAGSAPAA